jgi:hypothetical protein
MQKSLIEMLPQIWELLSEGMITLHKIRGLLAR